MKKINFSQHVLPHLLALFIFLVIVFVFYQPVFLTNKTIYQNDILQWEGGARELIEYREQTGEEGLWSNSMFSGMPGYLIDVRYSGDLSKYLFLGFGLWLPSPASQTFAALVCFYILLMCFRVRPYLAIVGAIAFGLNSYNLINIEAGHNMKGWAIAFMPLVLGGIHLSFAARNKLEKITGYVLTAIALTLHIRCNHLQMTYYLLLIVLIYGFIQLIYFYRKNLALSFFKTTGILALVALLALGASFGKIYSVYEFSKYSIRGEQFLEQENENSDAATQSGLKRDYAFQWSNGIAETFTLLVPYFYGGASQESLEEDSQFARVLKQNGVQGVQLKQYLDNVPTYWGNQPFTAGPIYAGAIICFLFILGLFVVDKPIRYWLLAATILSLALSWGKNFETFNYFMFDYFPGYNKFRSVSMAITMALICMPLLGFIGLEKLLAMDWLKENKKKFYWAAGIPALLLLLFILLGSSFFSFTGQHDSQIPEVLQGALIKDRINLFREDAFRSLIFIGLAALVIFLFKSNKLSKTLMIVFLGLFITVDLWAVDKRYLNEESFVRNPSRQFFAETEADQFIKGDPDMSYRVFNLQNPWQDARTSYHHQSLGGYHGAKMRRYQDLIDYCLGKDYQDLITDLQAGTPDFDEYGVINMLNAKYFVFGAKRNAVIENEAALGNAWFVQNVKIASSPNEELETLCSLNTREEAVVEAGQLEGQVNFEGNGTITLADFKPNYLKYEASASGEAFAIFSEIYYPEGWKAFIDGQEVEYLRANYLLRALPVPAGKHTVEFRFEPGVYGTGNTIMLISSLLLYLAIFGWLGYVYVVLR